MFSLNIHRSLNLRFHVNQKYILIFLIRQHRFKNILNLLVKYYSKLTSMLSFFLNRMCLQIVMLEINKSSKQRKVFENDFV